MGGPPLALSATEVLVAQVSEAEPPRPFEMLVSRSALTSLVPEYVTRPVDSQTRSFLPS